MNRPTPMAGPRSVASNITSNGFAVMTQPRNKQRRSMANPPVAPSSPFPRAAPAPSSRAARTQNTPGSQTMHLEIAGLLQLQCIEVSCSRVTCNLHGRMPKFHCEPLGLTERVQAVHHKTPAASCLLRSRPRIKVAEGCCKRATWHKPGRSPRLSGGYFSSNNGS